MGENKKIIVVDASVLIKWLAAEVDDRDKAEQMQSDYIKEKIKIFISSFTFWEIGNYLGRNLKKNIAESLFADFLNYDFEEISMDSLLANSIFDIMEICPKVSFYDASYHAIAIRLGGMYITADKKYYEQVKKLKHIRLLKDYGNW